MFSFPHSQATPAFFTAAFSTLAFFARIAFPPPHFQSPQNNMFDRG